MNEKNNVSIVISDDEYTAHITITPDPEVKLSLTELGPILKERGVVFGIKKDVSMTIVELYKKGQKIDNVPIAEGIHPFPGVKPDVEYKFDASFSPHEATPGKTDYHEISKFINIDKDQVLAVKKKFKKAIDGATVTGKRTFFEKFDDIPVLTGENIAKVEDDDYIYYKASVGGVLNFANKKLSVFPKLEIREDVDYSVGNIHFKGNVTIGRDVLPDFIIEASGKIAVWGSAIACRLKAGGSIDVRAGIVGKNKGEVDSGENIIAAFVENSRLIAKSDIFVKNGIIGSDVKCDGVLKMEMSRSRVVGSVIHASKGIIVFNAGSQFDSSTSLITGLIPEKEKEYFMVKETLDKRLKEAKDLEVRYGRSILEKVIAPPTFSPKAREDIVRWEVLKNEIQMFFEQLKNVEAEMYDNNAEIKVKETLSPRVNLSVGKGKLVTTQEYYNVTVRYSVEAEQLLIL